MEQLLLDNEPAVRLTVFLGLLLAMAGLEGAFPRRQRVQPRLRRWFANLALVAIDTLAVRLAFFFLPALAVGVAAMAQISGFGLLHHLALPVWLEFVLALLVLDLAIWAQHLASHKIPLLWRLHRVHHADLDIDVTTALRFHPVEIVLSMAYKLAVIVLLGAPPAAVLLFEVILNGAAMFNHANLNLPLWLDRILRMVIVTPDFHRVHHSVHPSETDSNYGFNLTLWDRLFGTACAQPRDGHTGMQIGLTPYRDGPRQGLVWMLVLPFRRS